MSPAAQRRLVAAIIAVQVAVPAWLLATRGADTRPRAFGWQMFSGGTDRWAATVVLDDGTATSIDIDSLLLRPRVELNLDDAVVHHVCETVPAAASVEVAYGARSTSYPCS